MLILEHMPGPLAATPSLPLPQASTGAQPLLAPRPPGVDTVSTAAQHMHFIS